MQDSQQGSLETTILGLQTLVLEWYRRYVDELVFDRKQCGRYVTVAPASAVSVLMSSVQERHWKR